MIVLPVADAARVSAIVRPTVAPMTLSKEHRIALCLGPSLSLALAVLLLQAWRSEPHGYVAGFWFLPALAVGALGTLLSLPLLFSRDVRYLGIIIGASFLSLPVFFVIGATLAAHLDLVPWQNQEALPIGPEVQADLVIVFKEGISQSQIEEFRENTIGIPHPSGNGIALLPGLCSYLLVGSFQTKHGLDSVALSFCGDASKSVREAVKNRILNSEIVHRVYEDVVPAELELSQE